MYCRIISAAWIQGAFPKTWNGNIRCHNGRRSSKRILGPRGTGFDPNGLQYADPCICSKGMVTDNVFHVSSPTLCRDVAWEPWRKTGILPRHASDYWCCSGSWAKDGRDTMPRGLDQMAWHKLQVARELMKIGSEPWLPFVHLVFSWK